jgi:hypothetical protein
MIFGPFSEADADRIEAALNEKSIGFVREHSEAAIEDWRKSSRNANVTAYPHFQGNVENIFIEIDNGDHELKNELEPFGIVIAAETVAETVSDDDESGDFELAGREEYLCPKCSFTSNERRLCPKHRLPLVTFSEKVELRNSQTWKKEKIFWKIVAIAVAILAIYEILVYFKFV